MSDTQGIPIEGLADNSASRLLFWAKNTLLLFIANFTPGTVLSEIDFVNYDPDALTDEKFQAIQGNTKASSPAIGQLNAPIGAYYMLVKNGLPEIAFEDINDLINKLDERFLAKFPTGKSLKVDLNYDRFDVVVKNCVALALQFLYAKELSQKYNRTINEVFNFLKILHDRYEMMMYQIGFLFGATARDLEKKARNAKNVSPRTEKKSKNWALMEELLIENNMKITPGLKLEAQKLTGLKKDAVRKALEKIKKKFNKTTET